jgi:hypothetical protein
MYHETKCRIKFHNAISHDFTPTCGVKQIDVLSPTLFNLYINNLVNKGNNKITELRTILQRERKVKTHNYINRQSQSTTGKLKTENRNHPDLVQAFLKKWWVESDFKVPNHPHSLRLKGSGCHYNSSYNITGTK